MAAKTIFDVRRENLDQLIKDKFENNRSAFARSVDKSINMVNTQLTPNKNRVKPIGEKLARDYEERALLPRGWLDEDRGKGSKAVPVVGLTRIKGDRRTDVNVFPEAMVVGDAWLKMLTDKPAQIAHIGNSVVIVDTSHTEIDAAAHYVVRDGDVVTELEMSPLPAGKVAIHVNKLRPVDSLVLPRTKLDVLGRVIARMKIEKL